MGILFKKLRIGLIVLAVVVVLIMIGFYFGIRWASQDRSVLVGAPDQLLGPNSTVGIEQIGNADTSRAVTGISTWT